MLSIQRFSASPHIGSKVYGSNNIPLHVVAKAAPRMVLARRYVTEPKKAKRRHIFVPVLFFKNASLGRSPQHIVAPETHHRCVVRTRTAGVQLFKDEW